MTKDCSERPPRACKNCQEEGLWQTLPDYSERMIDICVLGHTAADCQKARLIDRSQVPDVPSETAWAELAQACKDRDLDDAKEALDKYMKSNPDATYLDLQNKAIEDGLKLWFIALERNLLMTFTNMDLQGNLGKKYTVSIRFSDKPSRPKEKDGWPESQEEILARLDDAGEVVGVLVPKCTNCDQLGHTRRECTEEKNEPENRPAVKCYNCDEEGHRVRDCATVPIHQLYLNAADEYRYRAPS